MDIASRASTAISVEAAIDLYRRSPLGKRRLIDCYPRLGFEHNPRAWVLRD